MKLIDYAHKMGISDKTVWRWHKAGKIPDKLVLYEHVWATLRQRQNGNHCAAIPTDKG
jgi:predicted site-specific integrase-resolvase